MNASFMAIWLDFAYLRMELGLDEIEIIDEYKYALEAVLRGTSALFVTGKAGTGKSTLIKYLSQALQECVILAPTAAAAINAGGDTLHSFFGLPSRHIDAAEKLKLNTKSKKIVEKMRALIIDEVSMVTPNIVDVIDKLLRQARKSKEPFGGVSVVLVGDLLQLPPVLASKEEEAYFSHRYATPFFYSADVFGGVQILPVHLTKVRRQADAQFIEALGRIRSGESLQEAMEYFNRRCATVGKPREDAIRLVSTNAAAHAINSKKLSELSGETKEYEANVEGDLPAGKWRLPTPEKLQLKVGAKVVFLRNNKLGGWINGDTGEVVAFGGETLSVKNLSTGEVLEVKRMSWERYKYSYDEKTKTIDKQIVGSFEQFPVALGWAVTIHKSQGMTLDSVVIDLGSGAFCDGQSYVALSRCRSVEGIKLARGLNERDVRVNRKAVEFYRGVRI